MRYQRSSPRSAHWRWQKISKFNITLETDRAVYADRVRFKQILYNLMSNAVKFTPKEGRIDIDCHEDGNSVRISVTDTGIGIRAEDQAVIFEEFRQVEGRPTRPTKARAWVWRLRSGLWSSKGAEFPSKASLGKAADLLSPFPQDPGRSETLSRLDELESLHRGVERTPHETTYFDRG